MKSYIVFFRFFLLNFCTISLIFFLTSSSCGSDTDNRPLITDVHKEVWDLSFDQESLRYDISKFWDNAIKNGSYYPAEDMDELASYSGLYGTGKSKTTFRNLLINNQDFSGEKGEVKFVFYEPDCKGYITKVYRDYDESLCEGHFIKDAPFIKKPHAVELHAHTIKTSRNNISVKWNKIFSATGVGIYLLIDCEGEVDYPSYLYTSGTKGGNQVAVRVEGNRILFLENTIPDEVKPAEYIVEITDERPYVPDVLQQDVNHNGSNRHGEKWDVPYIALLETR